MVAEEVIIRPIITEKSNAEMVTGKYTFEVNKKATKIEIRNAVEKLFGVKVKNVSTINVKGKPKRQGENQGKTSDWKKAIVSIDTNPGTLKYKTKGGKEATSNKKFKASIDEFGA
jgi:large subunit ribosomal protein L23